MVQERAVITVTRHEGLWRAEHDGETFGQSADKEVARAAASRRARELHDVGRPCQVRIQGEYGFWAG